MADYNLSYTGALINLKLGLVKTEAELTTLAENAFKNSTVQSTTVSGSGFTCYCYKYGRIAYLTIIGGSTSAALALGATIMTLPAAYKPIQTVEAVDSYNSTHPRIRVITDGAINTPGAIASGTNIRVSFCYITAT